MEHYETKDVSRQCLLVTLQGALGTLEDTTTLSVEVRLLLIRNQFLPSSFQEMEQF